MSFVNEHEQTFESEFVDVQLPGEGGNGNITVDQAVIENSKNPVSGGAVKKYVDEQISKIEIPEGESVDLTDYYTKEEIDNKKYVTQEYIDNVTQGFKQWSEQKHQEIRDDVDRGITELVTKHLVLKENGKGLSTNDFTDEYKTKLDASISQEYVDKQIGDIETALDSILALQNSYIGGAE